MYRLHREAVEIFEQKQKVGVDMMDDKMKLELKLDKCREFLRELCDSQDFDCCEHEVCNAGYELDDFARRAKTLMFEIL